MSQKLRTAIYIDGPNIAYTFKALNLEIDYRRLLEEFQNRGFLVRASYYTASTDDENYSSVRSLTSWLSYNGYNVVTKPAKEITDAFGRRKMISNMGIHIAVDALELVDRIDHMIFFSGNGDIRYLVQAIQRKGVRVSVASSIKTEPIIVSDELRRQADEFIELSQLASRICQL